MAGKRNLYETDPEFMERFDAFAFREVVNEPGQQLDDETRFIAIIANKIIVNEKGPVNQDFSHIIQVC